MVLLRQHTVVFCLLLVAIAALVGDLFPPSPQIAAVGEQQRVRGVLRGTVSAIGRRSRRGWTLELALERVDGTTIDERSRVRLFVPDEYIDTGGPPAFAGDRVEVFGRIERYPAQSFPRRPSLRQAMAGRGIDARATALEPIVVLRAGGARSWLERTLEKGRASFEGRFLDGLDGQKAAIAIALTTGNRAFLEPETVAPFRQTGTSHLLAISGLHLGVFAAILWWLCGAIANRFPGLLRRFGRRRVCGLAVVILLGCYVLAIGAPVSAVRAWVAVAVGVAAIVLLRPLCPFHALAVAAIGLIAWQPAVVADLGFQLSFSATLGILLFLRYRPQILKPPRDPFAEPESSRHKLLRSFGLFVGVSTSATLATWPCVAAHFGEVALCGLFVNLVVTPVVSAVLFPLLVFGAVSMLVVDSVGILVLRLTTQALLAIGEALDLVADSPGAQLVTGAAPAWAVLALAIGALLAVTSRWRRGRLLAAAAAIAIGLSASFFSPITDGDGELEVHFIPVGQGDATFVRFPDGSTMLVDGGGSRFGSDPGRFVVVPYLRRLGVARLDWVVVTHADIDHLGGLFAVVEQMRPRHLVYDARETERSLAALRELAAREGVELHGVRRRVHQRVGGAGLTMIRPQVSSGAQNDASLVARLVYRGAAVLLAGDVERPAERWLAAHEPLRATVLKVPHHGSKTSSSARFLDAVRPQIAIISAGRFSRFGHPHAQVIERYRRRDVDVLETAKNGLVRVAIGAGGVIEVQAVR